jgi:transcriptional regulator with XRE-family HTH domain
LEFEPFVTTEEWERRFGEEVRGLRIRRCVTQAQLAESANVSLSAVKYLESGRGSSLSTLIRIARVLERTDWLASFAPREPALSPMAMLRERQRAERSATKRVRRTKAPTTT